MKIVMNEETLLNAATQIRAEKDNFLASVEKMKMVINGMDGEFVGDAEKAYKANFESYNSQFTQFSELIESFAKKLDVTRETMRDVDDALASQNGA